MENPPVFSEKDEGMKTGQKSAIPADMKSIIFDFLGVTEEDMENFLYFAKKVNEESTRKRQESMGVKKSVEVENVDTMDVDGNLSLSDYSEKSTDESNNSTYFPLSPFSVLNFYVPRKQRASRGNSLMGTSCGASFLKKVENPVMADLETRLSDAKQFKVFMKVPNNHGSDRGKPLETYGTGFLKKLGAVKDFEWGTSGAEKVENKRKYQKRCRESSEESEEEKLNRPKRQKDGKMQNNRAMSQYAEWGLVPPPGMPSEFKILIADMGGYEEKLLIQKMIFKTDLSKSHNRLQIPENQVTVDFLTEEEERALDKGGLDVQLIEPCLKISNIHLTRWNMKNSRVLVFNREWNSVVEGNQSTLKKDAVVQIWSFRTAPNSALCFAMVKVRDGTD